MLPDPFDPDTEDRRNDAAFAAAREDEPYGYDDDDPFLEDVADDDDFFFEDRDLVELDMEGPDA